MSFRLTKYISSAMWSVVKGFMLIPQRSKWLRTGKHQRHQPKYANS